jgi:hypothetical protein
MTANPYFLSRGSHATAAEGRCAMEWVAYVAGEPHSDSPKCVCPALRRFGIGINDSLPDDLRQQLRPYLGRMIGTADDGRMRERLFMLVDWAVHVPAVEAQVAVGREDAADRLRAIPPIVGRDSARAAAKIIRAADATHAAYAAYAAAYATATAAAAAATDDAATAAAYDAAYAAADAAAYAAADAAAYAAAHAAAAARRQMWERLLSSALDLLDRMLPKELVEMPEQQACRLNEVVGV